MKKWLMVAGLFLIPALFAVKVVMADGSYSPALVTSQTTQQGYLYTTSSNTAGGFLVGNAGGLLGWSNAPIVGNSTGTAAQFFPAFPSLLTTQLIAMAPINQGQIVYCSNCTQTPVCVSSGTGVGAWVAVSVSTSPATNGFGACK